MIVDVRIIVEGISDAEMVSKAVEGLSLGSNYSITISSIIPTTVTSVAKNSIQGADIVLIAMDADQTGEDHTERLLKELKKQPTRIEKVKIPFKHDIEHLNVSTIRNSIQEALVRIGLKSTELLPENQKLKKQNQKLNKKVEQLQTELKEKQKQTTDLKIYDIQKLWTKLFETKPPIHQIRQASGSLGIEGEILVGEEKIAATNKDIVKELFRTVYLANSLKTKEKTQEQPTTKEGKDLN